MFDRPKPTVGCSANGRRRRRRKKEKKMKKMKEKKEKKTTTTTKKKEEEEKKKKKKEEEEKKKKKKEEEEVQTPLHILQIITFSLLNHFVAVYKKIFSNLCLIGMPPMTLF